jgi:hypothetical protein
MRTRIRRGQANVRLMATLSLRHLWAMGVLKVLASLIEHGDYDELHERIKRQIERIRSRRQRVRGH